MPSPDELTARFPNLVGLLDLPAIKAAARQLETVAAPVDLTRFDVIRKIGAGGMATVYEAIDREQNMRVALKTMRRNTAVDLFRLKQEFRSLADIVHPNLVRLYELVSDGKSCLYTMELIDGIDFRSWVCRSGSAGTQAPQNFCIPPPVRRRLPWERRHIPIVRRCCEANLISSTLIDYVTP